MRILRIVVNILMMISVGKAQFAPYSYQSKTVQWPSLNFLSEDTMAYSYYLQNQWGILRYPLIGPVFGNNLYADKIKAQVYTPEHPVQITKVLIGFGAKRFNSGDTNSHVLLKLYALNGVGYTKNSFVSAPGSSFYEKKIFIHSIDTIHITEIAIDSLAQSADKFAVGIDFSGLAAGDTVILLSTKPGIFYSAESSWERNQQDKNYTIESAWSFDCTPALFPVTTNATLLPNNLSKDDGEPIVWVQEHTLQLSYLKHSLVGFTLNIYNVLGEKIFNTQIQDQEKVTIATTQWPEGNYFVLLVAPDSSKKYFKKVVVGTF